MADILLRRSPGQPETIVDKRFNDKHGHDVGDQVLRLVATRLERGVGGGVLKLADEALYRAKRGGRNRVVI